MFLSIFLFTFSFPSFPFSNFSWNFSCNFFLLFSSFLIFLFSFPKRIFHVFPFLFLVYYFSDFPKDAARISICFLFLLIFIRWCFFLNLFSSFSVRWDCAINYPINPGKCDDFVCPVHWDAISDKLQARISTPNWIWSEYT